MEAGPLVTFLWSMLLTWRLTPRRGAARLQRPRGPHRSPGPGTSAPPSGGSVSATAATLACASVSELARCAVQWCRSPPRSGPVPRPVRYGEDHDLCLGFNVGW